MINLAKYLELKMLEPSNARQHHNKKINKNCSVNNLVVTSLLQELNKPLENQ